MEALSHTRYDAKPLQIVPRACSGGRFWTGFTAATYTGSGGYTEDASLRRHNVSMLVGPPIRTVCRCDGAISQRFQVPGEFDVIPAGSSYAAVDEGPATFLSVNLSHMLVRTAAFGMDVDPDRVAIQPHLHRRDPLIEHICWALVAELETAEPVGRLYADSLGLALAAQLLRRYAALVPPRIGPALSKRRLQVITDYIDAHLAHELSLLELAHVADVSPSHFKSLFRQSVGLPVHQYVIRRRVERAIDLLLSSRLPASEIALVVGFANQSHMARCMRRVAGMTPSVLRKTA